MCTPEPYAVPSATASGSKRFDTIPVSQYALTAVSDSLLPQRNKRREMMEELVATVIAIAGSVSEICAIIAIGIVVLILILAIFARSLAMRCPKCSSKWIELVPQEDSKTMKVTCRSCGYVLDNAELFGVWLARSNW
jgi:DNA-directed RNA polymerase subunit RPC12/RpoP